MEFTWKGEAKKAIDLLHKVQASGAENRLERDKGKMKISSTNIPHIRA